MITRIMITYIGDGTGKLRQELLLQCPGLKFCTGASSNSQTRYFGADESCGWQMLGSYTTTSQTTTSESNLATVSAVVSVSLGSISDGTWQGAGPPPTTIVQAASASPEVKALPLSWIIRRIGLFGRKSSLNLLRSDSFSGETLGSGRSTRAGSHSLSERSMSHVVLTERPGDASVQGIGLGRIEWKSLGTEACPENKVES